MNPFIKSMIFRLIFAFLLIGIGTWGGIFIKQKGWLFFLLGILLITVGACGTILVAQDFNNLWKISSTKRLDGYAIKILAQMNGLVFSEKNRQHLNYGVIARNDVEKKGLNWDNFVDKLRSNGWVDVTNQREVRLTADLDQIKDAIQKVFSSDFDTAWGILQRIQYNKFQLTEYLRASLEVGNDISALRYLNNLGLIECDTYPSDPSLSWSYFPTSLGRHLLSKELNRQLYPEVFCDLLRIRYWIAYKKEFNKRKTIYFFKYFVTWDKAWNELRLRLEQLSPKAKEDPLGVLNEYLNDSQNNFDIIMQQLINPWIENIKK